MTTSPHDPAFVAEMKTKLLEEKASLERELAVISNRRGDDYQSKFPEYGRNDEENAVEMADYQATASTTETLEARLQSVLSALKRVEQGTYGVTAEGETIPEERLRANPAATTIIKT